MTNLLTLLETVTKCLDNGNDVDIIFLDFAKAFDKVSYLRLFRKLESHGITGKLKNLIEDWLNGRTQRTCFGGKKPVGVEYQVESLKVLFEDLRYFSYIWGRAVVNMHTR